MHYLPLVPDGPPLAGAVEIIFHLSEYRPDHAVERIVPNGRISLIIALDDRPRYVLDNRSLAPIQRCERAWLSGVHTRYLSIGALDDTTLVGVQLPPGAGYPIIHRPLHELNDRVVPAHDVLGPGVLAVRDAVIAARGSAAKLRLVEGWLRDRYDPSLAPRPEITAAVDRITANATVATLEGLVAASGFSHKHFIHLFKRYVGPSPKHLQRILRFAAVMPRILGERRGEQDVDWAALSADCGYYDQSHFIKDFYRSLATSRAGSSPRATTGPTSSRSSPTDRPPDTRHGLRSLCHTAQLAPGQVSFLQYSPTPRGACWFAPVARSPNARSPHRNDPLALLWACGAAPTSRRARHPRTRQPHRPRPSRRLRLSPRARRPRQRRRRRPRLVRRCRAASNRPPPANWSPCTRSR